jgi:hypothetical protein
MIKNACFALASFLAIGRIGAGLVRAPQLFPSIYALITPLLVVDPAARPLNRMPNGVDIL